MNCKKYQDKIPLYALGELEENEEKAIQKHLKECPDCQKEYSDIRNIITAMSDVDGYHLNYVEKLQIENEIYRKLAGPKSHFKSKSFIPKTVRISVSIAAAVILFFLGFLAGGDYKGSLSTDYENQQIAGYSFEKYASLASGQRISSKGLFLIANGKSAFSKLKSNN